jgi:hypothetical protein
LNLRGALPKILSCYGLREALAALFSLPSFMKAVPFFPINFFFFVEMI